MKKLQNELKVKAFKILTDKISTLFVTLFFNFTVISVINLALAYKCASTIWCLGLFYIVNFLIFEAVIIYLISTFDTF